MSSLVLCDSIDWLLPTANELHGRTNHASRTRREKALKQIKDWAKAKLLRRVTAAEFAGLWSVWIWQTLPRRNRRDADSHLKLVLDGLAGVLYRDDVQVLDPRCPRRWGDRVEIQVCARPITIEQLGPWGGRAQEVPF